MEPIVKLQNFVATDIKVNPNSRFSSMKDTHQRKASEMSEDQNDDDYEEDFESLSKSQAGLSLQLSVKKSLNKKDDDSYSNEFESLGDSKVISNEATVICFMCKQQIPKS